MANLVLVQKTADLTNAVNAAKSLKSKSKFEIKSRKSGKNSFSSVPAGSAKYNGYFTAKQTAESVFIADGATWNGTTSQPSAYYVMNELRTIPAQAVSGIGFVFLVFQDNEQSETYPDATIEVVSDLNSIPETWTAYELIAEIQQGNKVIQRWQNGTPRLPVYSTLCRG